MDEATAFEVEAALIDGCGPARYFWKLLLPASSSGLAALAVIQSRAIWNDLLFGLTLSQSPEVRPVMTALSALSSAYAGTRVPIILAGGILVSLPTVALFLLTQRIFARGLALGQF